MQSTRLTDPFEPLNSSLAQSAEELGRKGFEPETPAGHPKYQKTRIVA